MADIDTLKKRFTADDLLKLPADGKRYELNEGELVEMSPAGYEHRSIAAKAISKLVV